MPTSRCAEACLPDYGAFTPEALDAIFTSTLAAHAAAMDAIVAARPGSVAHTLVPKEHADAELNTILAAISHLSAVVDTPGYRLAFRAVDAAATAYRARLGQDKALFEAVRAAGRDPAISPDEARAAMLCERDFLLSGVALPPSGRARLASITAELAEVSIAFSNALVDAAQAWTRTILEEELAGLPAHVRGMLAAAAEEQGQEGWLATLAPPVTQAILVFAETRSLRAEVYHASVTRASEQGPHAGKHDNGERITRVLALRREAAKLLGYEDFVARSLATKMAGDRDEVVDFLLGLAERARPAAMREIEELRAFAAAKLGIEHLEAWDFAFASERLRQERYQLDEKEITRFFPADHVLAGLCGHVEGMFGISLREVEAIGTWHPDVRQLAVLADGKPIGYLLLDLHARTGKRDGAWMGDARPRLLGAGDRPPLAYLTCNFAPSVGGKPALLRHQDVATLFHEMGHCLHHVLTEIGLPSIGGINGVEWDAIELPSQFLESFAWDPSVLRRVSAHVETGEPLPDAVIERVIGARGFHAGIALMRQVELAVLDLELHLLENATVADVDRVAADVSARFAVLAPPGWNRFVRSFSHLFAGSYGAGYYGYLWAERMSADAYEAFVDPGADRLELGRRFRREVLARGASRATGDNFAAFRGRPADSGALLRQRGLAA